MVSAMRPPALYPLFADLTSLPGIGAKTAALFARLGVARVRDLVLLAPTGVVDRRLVPSLIGLVPGQIATLPVQVQEVRAGRSPSQPTRVVVAAPGGFIELVYFKTRPDWLARTFPLGARRVVSGRLELYEARWQMAHPDWVLTEAEAADVPPWEPVYPLTAGLTQRMVGRAVQLALARLPVLDDWLDPGLCAREGWPGWAEALRALHAPQGTLVTPARHRLAYDELLSHQLALQLVRAGMRRGKGRASAGDGALRARAAAAFGHPPTGAQTRALAEIATDMGGPERMMRLLQGDVGAGKTYVALMALLLAVEAGGQGALMAPTEILARQHGAGLARLAQAAGVETVVLTGRDKGAGRADLLARIADGRAQIVIGTHALIQGSVAFHDLRLIVIDEQHRFGVRQRMELTAKAPQGPDVLVMTATPIPRTLALAGYGDLDVSILEEKPPGRQPIDTRLIDSDRVDEVVARLQGALATGARAYWVCPLVEANETIPWTAAAERHADLVRALGPDVALVHGQMSAEDKEAAMAAFQSGAARVLVATTVIEVGVDVPQATIMVVEQAETFGLAQLHQLRGRVGRGAGRSFCLLLYTAPLGETARARLETLRETEDGFRIAEADLGLRGPGDVLGTAQSGLPQFAIADLATDGALLQTARDDARLVLHNDPGLTGPRANALKSLLYLMERDESVRLMKSG